jgi:hypothetical protein
MSVFGIGLGGFVDGFTKGYGIREDMEDRKDKKAQLQRENAWQDEERGRQRMLWGRDDEKYQRDETNRQNIEDIGKDAKTQFDQDVQDGKQQPDNFENFYNSYALPRMRNEFLSQGKLAEAKALDDWSDTAGAKAGAKLFGSALTKLNIGNPEGALDDFIAAGQTKGYLDHDLQFVSKDRLVDNSGKLLGFRVTLKDAKGKPLVQDVPVDKIADLGATLFSPESAFKSQIDARANAAKQAQELDTYKKKKEIDKTYGVPDTKQRTKAIDDLRKRLDGGMDLVSGQTRPDFNALPRDQQEKMIANEISLQNGDTQPGLAEDNTPKRKVIVDTVTGQRHPAAGRQADRCVAESSDRDRKDCRPARKRAADRLHRLCPKGSEVVRTSAWRREADRPGTRSVWHAPRILAA